MPLRCQSHKDRSCPVCGATGHTHFADERLDINKIGDFTYASRKQPEFMCLRLVRCNECELIYAPNPPDTKSLSSAYAEASYDSGIEAHCAARSYAYALAPYLERLSMRGAAVDVGAGCGPLLPWLSDMGFHPAIGIEPSRAAIKAAPASVRSQLREGMFSPDLLADITPSLVCSFMTLEHVADPGVFAKTVYNLLDPGGMFAVAVHNWQGLLNRILGLRSPIIDVEHLQLFNTNSVRILLKVAGFEDIEVKPISNTYPLAYWLRLTPLPTHFKAVIGDLLKTLSLADIKIPFRVGNILAVGTKPKLEKV